jgi:hypothetical protein
MKIEYKISIVYSLLAILVLAAVPLPSQKIVEPIQVLTGPNEVMRTLIEIRVLMFSILLKIVSIIISSDFLVMFIAGMVSVKLAKRMQGGILLNMCGWAYAVAQMVKLFTSKLIGLISRIFGASSIGGEIIPLFPDSFQDHNIIDPDQWDVVGSDDTWRDTPKKLVAKK